MTKFNLQNLFVLAETAEESGNFAEAYDYYTKILEEDTHNSKAWFGKGKAAGWQSTIKDNRLSETTVAFQKAIECASNEKKDQYIHDASEVIAELVLALSILLNGHLQEFISCDDTYNEYVDWWLKIIMCLEEYHVLTNATLVLNNPKIANKHTLLSMPTIELLINICKYNLEGVSYNDAYKEKEIIYTLTVEYKDMFKNRFDALVLIAQEIDPNYQTPEIAKCTNYIKNTKNEDEDEDEDEDETDSCFVATATMGNANHPEVMILRRLRDKILLSTTIGNDFINYYYRIGPKIANIIHDKLFLRKLSYLFIVFPISKVARVILLLKKGGEDLN